MRRARVAVMAALVVLAALISVPAADAAPAKFTNCHELNKQFPNGVARGADWAALAVKDGFLPPTVRVKVWGQYFLKARFETRGFQYPEMLLCGRKKPEAPPTSVEYLKVTPTASYKGQPPNLFASWSKPAIGNSVIYDVYLNGQLWKEGLTTGGVSIAPLAAETVYTVGVLARNPAGSGPLLQVQGTTFPQWRYDHYGEVLVRYEMSGSAGSYSLTMASSNGGTIQRDAGNGTAYEAWFRSGDFVYVSGQNNNESGSVTCTIFRNGVAGASNTSEGAYVIASCSGRA